MPSDQNESKPRPSGKELQKHLNTPLECKVCHMMLNRRRDGYYQCPSCNSLYRDNLMKTKEFLLKNPDASFEEICEGAFVSEDDLNFFLDNGMISIPDTNKNFSKCKYCGRVIVSGRYCNNCALHTFNRLQKIISGEEDPEE